MTRRDSHHAASPVTANGASTGSKPNNWTTAGPAAFDFRSDVVTTPTASMLAAITECTLLDDVFVEDPTTNNLESFIAELTGHPAALLVLSGTMANQVALRAHLQGPPHSILCDRRAHILAYEAGGCASLSQALVVGVQPKNGVHLTLEDVVQNAVVSDNVHVCPTRVISLENTLGGAILPLEECRKISTWARERGIIVHLDGARLWEAVASGAGTLKEYSACFDSVSLCFSKGLGAPVGSIVVGNPEFIKRARWIRKSIGGGLRQAGVVSAAARVAVEETFLGGKLSACHEKSRMIEKMWISLGGKIELPVETNMVWLDLKSVGISNEEFVKMAQEEGLRAMGGRLVVHYQISEEAIERLERLCRRILQKGEKRAAEDDQIIEPKKMKIQDTRS